MESVPLAIYGNALCTSVQEIQNKMPDIDAIFGGMNKAEIFGRGTYMKPGVYLVELTKVDVKPRRAGGNVFIAEFKVLESDNLEHHKPGSSGCWVPKIENANTFGDIKCLIFSATGVDPKQVRNDDTAKHEQATLMAKAACGSESAKKALNVDDGFLNGAQVRLECTNIKTKTGMDFTRYTWGPA